MAIYEYRCEKCGKITEVIHAKDQDICCECGGKAIRIISLQGKGIVH